MAKRISGITIELDGDTKKLGEALKEVNKKSSDLYKELRQVESALKFNPGNAELLAQKQKLMSDQVENSKEKLKLLKQAQSEFNAEALKTEEGQAQYRELQREIVTTESKIKSMDKQLEETNKKLSGANWTAAGERISAVGDGMQKAGKGMSTYVTAPILAVGAAAQMAWGEVDNALDGIATATGATGDKLAGMGKVMNDVAGSMPAEIGIVGAAIGELNTQFGFTDEALDAATRQMVKFAEINGADVVMSTQGARKAMDLFGLSGDDLSDVLDRVTKIAQDTGQSTDQIFASVVKGGPQLKALNLSFDEGATIMAEFDRSGIDSAKAMGYLTKAQATLAKDGKSLGQGLGELNAMMKSGKSETEMLTEASKLFGAKGASFMLEAAQRGSLDFGALAKSAENASGTVARTFDETLDPADKMKVAMNNLKLVGADLAQVGQELLVPALEKLVGFIKGLKEKFDALSPGQKDMIVKILGIIAVVGPLLLIIGKVISVIGAIVSGIGALGGAMTILTGPIGLVVAAIAAVIAIGILLYKNWDEIWGFLCSLWEGIKSTAESIWNGIKDFFSGIWGAITGAIMAVWEGIKSFFTGIWNGISDTASSIWNGVTSFFSDTWNSIKKTASEKWEGIKSTVSTAWEGMKSSASSIWGSVTTFFSNTWEGIKSTASTAWSGIKSGIETGWNNLKDNAASILGTMKSAWDQHGGGVKGAAAAMMEGTKKYFSDGFSALDNITGGRLSGLVSAISDKWQNIKSKTSEMWESIKSAITRPIESAKEFVGNMIERIKSFFRFDWSLPKIKMPHFSITGKFSLAPPSIPRLSVDWYDKGGIFTAPTIIGVGEKRPEFVGALDDLRKLIREEMGTTGRTIVVQQMNVREEADIRRIAKELDLLDRQNKRSMGVAFT